MWCAPSCSLSCLLGTVLRPRVRVTAAHPRARLSLAERQGWGQAGAAPVKKTVPLGLWLILRSSGRGRVAHRKLPLDLNYYWLEV